MNLPPLPPPSRLAILCGMKTYLRTAVLAIAIATLCACGAKGPLFMPEEDAPMEMPPDEAEAGLPGAEVDADADDVDGSDEAEEAEEAEEADPAPPDDGA